MENTTLIEIIAYTLPSFITGLVAYQLFKLYFKEQQNTRRWLLQKENQKDSLPLRLQAYERMALFLERINPSNLLIRVTPFSSNKDEYESLIIEHINQEYEHNITQQIYLTNECWTIIVTAKNTTIQNVRKANMNEKVNSANKLREIILRDLLEGQSPSTIALGYLKEEVSTII